MIHWNEMSFEGEEEEEDLEAAMAAAINEGDSENQGEEGEDLEAAMAAAINEGDSEGEGDSGEGDLGASMMEAMGLSPDDEDVQRVLNQNEIDSLLGIEGDKSEKNVGIEALLNSGKVSYERLPMLEVIFDRLVRHLSTSLRNFTNENVEVNLENITSIRFGDYLNSIALPALIGVYGVKEWEDSFGLITADSSLIYSIVDMLLGAKRGSHAPKVEGRPYTTIERSLAEKLLKVVLGDFSTSFEPVSPVNFYLDRLETNPGFVTIVRPINVSIVVKIMIEMENRGGEIEFLIPYSSLEPVRDSLLQMFMGEKFGQDMVWEKHFASELWETKVPIEGVLKTLTMKLDDVLNWEKGSQISLGIKPDANVILKCGEFDVGRGRMGQKNNRMAIQVEKSYIKEKKAS